jgi:enoyl-CoA hydratase
VSDLKVERGGAVLTLTIDREEKRNALSGDVLRGMLDATRSVEPSGDIRVIVVAAAGEKVFCSGADLAVMTNDATGLEQHEGRGLLRDVVLAFRACPVPVVARVQGLCLAGGVGLAMGCDVVLASSAAMFGLPEVGLGLWPFMVSALLARHVSPKHGMDLMLSAERIDAHTAYRMGLVSRVFPAESFAADTAAYVERLAAAPPVAVRLGKAAWATAEEAPLAPALEAMQAQLSLLTTTRDAAEGVAAFFEKRPPNYTGR